MTNLQSVLTFDGQDDYVATTLDAQPSALPAITWEAWVKPTRNINNWEPILSTEDGGWDRGVSINAGRFLIYHGKGAWNAAAVDINQWQHIAVAYAADKQVKFYKNGTEYTCPERSSIGGTKNTLHIGHSARNSSHCFQGSITEVRVWDRVREPADIQRDMNHRLKGSEPGLVGYWPLNEGNGVLAQDKSSNDHNGNISGATWEKSELSLASQPKQRETHSVQNILSFGGKDNYIDCGNGINLVDTSFTLECWAKRQKPNVWHVIVSQGNRANNKGLHFAFRENVFTLAFYGDDLNSPSTYTDTDWHHWCGVYDFPNQKQILYCDGSEICQHSASPFKGTGTFYIGAFEGKELFFEGKLGELRVWKCVRTPAEIKENMHRRLQGNEDGLVGYWPLNEGSGETVGDRSANSNNGTIHGATWETAEVPIQERDSVVSFSRQQSQGTGLKDYTYWYHWEKNLPKQTDKKPFRRGRIWA